MTHHLLKNNLNLLTYLPAHWSLRYQKDYSKSVGIYSDLIIQT